MTTFQGDDLDNVLQGTADDDTIFGFGGNDQLWGKGGNDTLWGGPGNDLLLGGSGADTFYGLAGFDEVSYLGAGNFVPGQGVVVYMDGTPCFGSTAQGDRLFGVESVIGTPAADSLHGTSGNDVLDGWTGNDFLYGYSGDDWFAGSNGAVNYDGGTGVDTLAYRTVNGLGVAVDLRNGIAGHFQDSITVAFDDTLHGIEVIDGTQADDLFFGSDAIADTFSGGAGSDVVFGSKGADSLHGGDDDNATDYLSYLYSGAGVSVDLLNNTASGGYAQGDQISGFEAVQGSTHDDVLKGTGGANVFDADEGVDTITGRGGADRFQFWYDESGIGAGHRDIVTDFSRVQGDKVDLSSFDTPLEFVGSAGFSGEDQVRYVQKNGFTLVQFEYDDAHPGADMAVQFTGQIAFKATDFLLT